MSTTVTYVPRDPPMDMGHERWGMTGEGRRFLYGAYRVDYDDGYHVYIPHSAIQGTISAEPPDLDATDFAGTNVREMLIEQADQTRVIA